MDNPHAARRIDVRGIVQGVGFRPFVYQLALKHDLGGEVSNTVDGVTIHLEGPLEEIEAFCRTLTASPPPLAHITEVRVKPALLSGAEAFGIALSSHGDRKATLISPDVCICQDCRRELFDPLDRRCGYPFINCTNCGPRYTIIADIPYDRPKTSMGTFTMCPQCQCEYDDPLDRRFHAQPNACAQCGPHVSLVDRRRLPVAGGDPIQAAAKLLAQGKIVAVKGLGGYHLAVDAANDAAVVRLRQRKHREEKPLALMARDLEAVGRFARVTPAEKQLLTSRQRPVVLLVKNARHDIAASVAPGNRYFGVMLPYTPLHYLLLDQGVAVLVMTSGNLSEEPIAIDNDDALERLADIADFFVVHNRDIYLRSDDSIAIHTAGKPRFIRRSRGYVPTPIFLKHPLEPVLACGAELKNTICLTKSDQAFVSQHIGDLENLATLDFFKLTIGHLQRILDVEPGIVAHDLHPDYLSTRHARELEGVTRIGVQHHHAHVVSCMAENKIDGQVVGFAFDGSGYGTDGHVWGGEILIAGAAEFERAAHLAYVPMPGSAAAIREPWRMALSYLRDAYGDQFRDLDLPLLATLKAADMDVISAMMTKRVNAPLTSSLGRLFDGVAAILGLRSRVAFEGQAAMELEMIAAQGEHDAYEYGWEGGPPHRIATAPIIRGVVADLLRGVSPADIAAKFHTTLIVMFSELAAQIAGESGLQRVVLSGGAFQNSLLLTGLERSLSDADLQVFTHGLVPCNDGGICLGQAVAAAALAAGK